MGGGGSKGKKTKSKVSAHDRALLDMKVQRDKLKQYQRKARARANGQTANTHLRCAQCERVMARETELAKQAAASGCASTQR